MTLKESIFEDHYHYYRNIGVETIKQQAGQVEQVSSDYQGRVIYEMLQNAFDKAESQILVKVIGDTLYIANDGNRFNYTANYDYSLGSSLRGDFQSLCSISTSTKNVSGSIGNKGVGFKSSFSISAQGFVNIYTDGEVRTGTNVIKEHIYFRIYDIFKDTEGLSEKFPPVIRQNIIDKLGLVRKERSDRGIPGYYFPLPLSEASTAASSLLMAGYVTVIEIPFADKEAIEKLIDEIKTIHFEFITIKYPHFKDKVTIKFESGKHDFEKSVGTKNNIYTFSVDNAQITKLAIDAGVNIEKPEIGIHLRDKPGGLMYNYLPTQVPSPFTYIDFHADFHTTVDRKAINFDGKVGAYNKALYRCCIEFYFVLLRGQMEGTACNMNLAYVNVQNVSDQYFFHPSSLKFVGDVRLFHLVQGILGIGNYVYFNASTFLAGLGKKYFQFERDTKDHEDYIRKCIDFITFFARTEKQQYYWITAFKKAFADVLKKMEVKVIPSAVLNDSSELFYRKSIDDNLALPDYLGVNITDFNVPDKELRDALGIKELSESNEVLKYFKQCTFSGVVAKEAITETDQQKLLLNVYRLFQIKTTQGYLSTHRFSKVATRIDRDRSSIMNQANCNVSTLFLKIAGGRYKPAQLCHSYELDHTFIPNGILNNDRENFLKFLGVSFDKDYIFADMRMHSKLREGLEYIPLPLKRNKNREGISAELVTNFRIISSQASIHPSLINDNDYKFLHPIKKNSLREELENLLVKKYGSFPPEYKSILLERLKQNLSWKADMIRFYQNIYKLYEEEDYFLVLENQHLAWVKGKDFKVVGNKADFDLYSQVRDRKLLCYHALHNVNENVRKQLVAVHKGTISVTGGETDITLKERVYNKFIYILLSISLSNNSEVNYLEDERDLNHIQERLDRLEVIRGTGLTQDIYFGDDKVMSGKSYAYNEAERKELYIEQNSNNKQVASALSEFLFDNLSIAESIELILFHKDTAVLAEEFDQSDIAIISKKWKKDFQSKFTSFQQEIENSFLPHTMADDKWYVYNSLHKSSFLIGLDRDGRLEELSEKISMLKALEVYEGYFEGFDLDIDSSQIVQRVSALRLVAERNQGITAELKAELLLLIPTLGIEEELSRLEEMITVEQATFEPQELEQKGNEVLLVSRIDRIHNGVASFGKKACTTQLAGGTVTKTEPRKKTFVFMGQGIGNPNGRELETIGTTGEEEVLMYFILEFMKFDKNKQKKAIVEIYEVLKGKLKISHLESYKKACLEAVGDKDLIRHLIPLFYVAMHAKYAYFDLIVYFNDRPTLIEVKTTHSESNNRFFMSAAEIDAARGEEAYEIVRVSPRAINFLGNPIRLVENHLASITGNNFTITPTNYEVRLFSPEIYTKN